MPINLRKYNNYDYSDAHIDHIIDMIENDDLDEHNEEKYLHFDVVMGHLVYLPFNLVCVKTSEKEETIRMMYENPSTGLGAGVKSIYNKLASRYLGINRNDVEQFLSKQTSYQLTKTVHKKTTNHPMIVKYCNHLWSCDLIDVETYNSKNRKRKYILTAIDHFSKYVFAVGLLNKEPNTIIAGFVEIFTNQSNVYPRKLISDNGTEFKNALFKQFCEDNNIVHVFTMSHSPKQNALIENTNGKIRRNMADVFVRNNSLNWIDHLQEILDSRNSDVHSVTKKAPNDIWKPFIDRELNPNEQDVKNKLDDKARENITKSKSRVLSVNDSVRILMSAIHKEVRKEIKSGNSKKIIVKYTPKIYRISRVIRPTGAKRDFQQHRYILRDDDNLLVFDDNDKPIKFYASDLLFVDHESPNLISGQDAHALNKMNIIDN
jgi:transposase InsO family protein